MSPVLKRTIIAASVIAALGGIGWVTQRMQSAYESKLTAQEWYQHAKPWKATALLEQKLQTNPKDLDTLDELARLYIYFERFPEACKYLNRELAASANSQPTQPGGVMEAKYREQRIHRLLGVCYYRMGQPDVALSHFEKLGTSAKLARLRCYVALGKNSEAKATLAEILKGTNLDTRGLFHLYMIAHDYDAAQKQVEELLADTSPDERAYMLVDRAAIFNGRGNYKAALGDCDKAIDLFGLRPKVDENGKLLKKAASDCLCYDVYANRAIANEALGNIDAAIADRCAEVKILEKAPRVSCEFGVRDRQVCLMREAYKSLVQLSQKSGHDFESRRYAALADQKEKDIFDHLFFAYYSDEVMQHTTDGIEQGPLEWGIDGEQI